MVWAFVERFPAPPVALRGPEHQGQTSSTVSSSKVHWSTPFQREKWLEYVWSIIKTHFSSKSVIIATPPNKTIQIGDQRKPVEVWTFSTISSSVCPGPHSDAHPGSFYPLPQGSWGSPKSTDSMVMPRGPTWKPLEWIPCRDTSWRPAMRTTGDNRDLSMRLRHSSFTACILWLLGLTTYQVPEHQSEINKHFQIWNNEIDLLCANPYRF